ncbi:MAG: undecaprenyl-phosphate glucose phosphotransferase [Bacteroidota bacterium]
MPNRRYSKFFPIVFLIADIISLNCGFYLANYLRFGSFIYLNDSYATLQIVLNIVWFFIFYFSKLHEINRESRLLDHLNKVLTALIINLSVVFALWFAAKPFYYSRQHLFFTYLFFTFFIIGWRSTWHYVIRYYRARGYNFRTFVVVGYGEMSQDLVQYFQKNPGIGYKFLGYFDNDPAKASDVIGDLSKIKSYALKEKVDIIFCYLPKLYDNEIKRIIDFAENNLIKVKILSQFSKLGNKNLTIQRYGEIPIVNVSAIPLDSRANRFVKRIFDIVFSGIILVLILSWLVPLVGLLIRLESPGPVFFIQKRNGLNDQPFSILKFRTMKLHDDSEVKQATKDDSRITKLGYILRKTSIDELPQFINVFLGDMSVVGPRPHAVKHNLEFKRKIDRFIQRHAVKPGITGLAQAKGYRGETTTFSDISGRVRLDRFYVKNWSLLLDFKIIILTIVSIVRGSENAY